MQLPGAVSMQPGQSSPGTMRLYNESGAASEQHSRLSPPLALLSSPLQESPAYDGAFSEESLVQLLELERQIMHNWTMHASDPQFDLLRQPTWRGLVIALYVTVVLVGTVGNAVVVFVVMRNRSLHTVTNVFIANLALSDVALCVFSLPVQLYYQLTDHWIFGEALCRVMFAAFAVPMYVSTLTILLIAADRYWLIVYPLRERLPLRIALALIVGVGAASAMLSAPVVAYTHLRTWNDTDLRVYRHYCIEQWPSAEGRMFYSISMFLLQFCAPLVATTLLYYRIYCRLRHRNRLSSRHQDRKQKTNKLLVAIVTLFIVCWLPWTLFSLVTEIDQRSVKGPHFKLVDVLLRAFAMGSACVNPFLYCWLNDNFHKELDQFAVRLRIYKPSSSRQKTPVPRVRIEEGSKHAFANGTASNGLLPPETTVQTGDAVSHVSTMTQVQDLTITPRKGSGSTASSSEQ